MAISYLQENGVSEALEHGEMRVFPRTQLPRKRIRQFDMDTEDFGYNPQQLGNALEYPQAKREARM